MAYTTDAGAREFSMHDSELMQNPYEYYTKLRESGCPVAHSGQLGGFYFTTTYAGTRRVYEDFRTFSSEDGTALPKQPLPLYPIDLDPPYQAKMRKVLMPLFLPEAAAKHRPRMQEVVNGFIDDFIERGEADLQIDLIRPTLSYIFLPFLGVPMEDREFLAHRLDYLTRHRADDPETCEKYGVELNDYLMNFIRIRRESPPKDDVMQVCLDSKIDGEPLTDMQILGIATLVLFGGLDTTSGVLGEALWFLVRRPDEADRLMKGEVDMTASLHEFVRYASPVQALRRTVKKDTELEGCPLKAGDYVMAVNGAANHDPEKFSRPDEIDLDRPPENEHDHLGFGGGAHLCIGQHLARTLMDVVIRSVLTRLKTIRMQDGFEPRYAVGESRVLQNLPVTFAPGPRKA